MHYHLEIIMPPVENVKEAVSKILQPFSEDGNPDAEDEYEREPSKHAFWDWWVIGGRYAGSHLIGKYQPDRLDAFYYDLKERKVTVSGVQFGKQELSPASQIPLVDELWQYHFPDEDGPCPVFKHYNDQFKDNYNDVCQIFNMPIHLKCSRVIITDRKLSPSFMIEDSYWNGVNWIESTWDGTVKSSIAMYEDKMKNWKEEFRNENAIESNWLLVTVDYHS